MQYVGMYTVIQLCTYSICIIYIYKCIVYIDNYIYIYYNYTRVCVIILIIMDYLYLYTSRQTIV